MRRETADSQRFHATRGDEMVAERARRQHGVVSLAQLREAGLGDGAILWRVRQGRLHRLHRGVYAVGHVRIDERGRLWAATLKFPGAVLSHRSAAAAWDLCPVPHRLDISTTRGSRSAAGIRVHRRATLAATTQHDGLRLTTVAQTLKDLAATETQHRLNRLVERAEHLRLLDTASLAAPASGRGSKRLRTALHRIANNDPAITKSELEERFLQLVAGAGLPTPQVNRRIEGFVVDFAWPQARLIVETDGAATHLTSTAFEADRHRDAVLTAAGWRVVRFTWRQVIEEPETVLSFLANLLRHP